MQKAPHNHITVTCVLKTAKPSKQTIRAISMFERYLVEQNLYDEVRCCETAHAPSTRQDFPFLFCKKSSFLSACGGSPLTPPSCLF